MCSPDTPFQWAKYTCAGSFSSTWQCVSCCRFGSASSIVVAPTDCSYPWSFISIRACLWVLPLLTGVFRYFLLWVFGSYLDIDFHCPSALARLRPRCTDPCLRPRCTGPRSLSLLPWSLSLSQMQWPLSLSQMHWPWLCPRCISLKFKQFGSPMFYLFLFQDRK